MNCGTHCLYCGDFSERLTEGLLWRFMHHPRRVIFECKKDSGSTKLRGHKKERKKERKKKYSNNVLESGFGVVGGHSP